MFRLFVFLFSSVDRKGKDQAEKLMLQGEKREEDLELKTITRELEKFDKWSTSKKIILQTRKRFTELSMKNESTFQDSVCIPHPSPVSDNNKNKDT